jgi:hypothetical protein
MNIKSLKKIVIILSLLVGGSNVILASDFSQSTFLFCLKSDIQPLSISKSNNKLSVDNSSIQNFIDNYSIENIEPWLPGARETDHDGDIYLNRIYRVYIGENRNDVVSLISTLDSQVETIYAEHEYIRKPLYNPNDPGVGNQCSLPAVKAFSAWDFWDIPNIMPGSGEKVLLSSVDTGVDYTHPDLVGNIWINQGELPPTITEPELFILLDTDGDGEISALEIISNGDFLWDINGDGSVDLKDALSNEIGSVSPFMDNQDNDGNGYVDDLIGWDGSGQWGTADNDPFPKIDGVANNSTWAHGSHVAGILAATSDNGVGMASTAFNGKIMSVKTSKDGPSTDDPGIWSGYQGILYSAQAGAGAGYLTIINNSWGGGGFSNSEQSTVNVAHNTYGSVVVAAAGNGLSSGGEQYGSHYPSSYENVVSVCAIGCSGNWGEWATYHPSVDLAAPGESIYSAIMGTGYEMWDGSSMASPNAASCIGLLAAYYPGMDNDQLIERILNTADRFIYDRNPEYETCNGYTGEDCLGKGMVDIYEAIGIDISPNIIIENAYFSENSDFSDEDGVINPGEQISLFINLENEQGWQDATDITVVLSTSYEGVSLNLNGNYLDDLNSGESDVAEFAFSLSNDIALGDIEFNLLVTATGPNNFQFEANLPFEFNVSLNQVGFPADVSGELISSAAVVDFDNDGQNEFISSAKSGFVHVFEMDGSEWLDGFGNVFYETGDQNWGSPAVGNLDGDGFDDVVISSKNGNIYIFGTTQANQPGSLLLDFDSGAYVTGTPTLGDIDGDGQDEIVFGQYGGDKLLYAINGDGSNVAGFPVSLDEKVQRGVALADFNGNGKMDIVVGTDDEFIHLIHDDGTIAWSYETGGDIRVAPTVLELTTGEKIVLAGSKDDNFYALNSDGTVRFMIETDDDIATEASVVDIDGVGPIIFFASGDFVYAVESDGTSFGNWPMNIGEEVISSVTFASADGYSWPLVMFGDDSGQAHIYTMDGEAYDNFPIVYSFPFKGSPTILDTDGDGDLEFILGSTQTLTNIDIKETGNVAGLWNTHRADMQRSGYYLSTVNALSVGDDIENYEFALYNAYPNPFNPSTTIGYEVPYSMLISLNVYDISGRLVRKLDNGFKNTGIHSVIWDGKDNFGNIVSNGLYIYRLDSDSDISISNKIIFMK